MEEKQELSFGLYQELAKALQHEKRLFFTIGKILKTIRDDKLYKYIGDGGFDTFRQFTSAPEINLTQPRVYFYIRVYEFYVEKMQISEAELEDLSAYKLFRLLPIIREKPKKEVMALIDTVRGLGVADTEKEINDHKLAVKPDRPIIVPCPICSKWIIKYKSNQLCQCEGGAALINEVLK